MLNPNELRFLANIAADRLGIAYRVIGCGMTPESVRDISAVVVRANEEADRIEAEIVEAQKKAAENKKTEPTLKNEESPNA